MTKLNYSVEDTSEDSPLDQSVGQEARLLQRGPQRTGDLRRIADAVALRGRYQY